MVHKVKIIKFIIMFLLFLVPVFLSLTVKGNTETNLMKTILPASIVKSTNIVPMADKFSSVIRVVFEAEDISELESLKNKFISSIDKTYFYTDSPDVSGLIELYLSNPANFLSDNSRNLLKNKQYDEIYTEGLNRLYNPAGIQLSSLEKDPYLLLDDFILSNKKVSEGNNYFDGKYYDFSDIKMKTKDGLSPDLSNKKISEIIGLQKKLSNNNSKIYLGGTPVHSYYTSKKSVVSINIICALSTFLIIFVTYYYFRSVKMLLPVALSIAFGMLTGYTATRLWFDNFQIVTMVFSTTLIGIGIDYSYHYCFASKRDWTFIKNLSLGLITTIIPFILFYITNIELLKQISVYIIFGLCSIYFFILMFYSCFELNKPQISLKFEPKVYKIMFILLLIAGVIGLFRVNYTNSLTALYIPSKSLAKAEALYNKVSGNTTGVSQFITVQGNNIEDMLEKEEKLTGELTQKGIEYLSLSKFLPSEARQQENFNLIKELYNKNLGKYPDILSGFQKSELKSQIFKPVIFDLQNYPYLLNFVLPENTSFIIAYTDDKIESSAEYIQTINIKKDVEKYMKKYSSTLLKIFPVILLILSGIFIFLYGIKKGLKLLIPPCAGTVLAVGLTSLAGVELNLFGIIALFMILGFTIDYSIFRAKKEKQTEDAVFASCLTTSFSFLLLSFSGFKLLSSISLVLFWGIMTSYITGYLLFPCKHSTSMVQSVYEENKTQK